MRKIRVTGLSGETVLERDMNHTAFVMDVACAIKKEFGIPRGEQRFLLDGQVQSLLAHLPQGDLEITFVRTPAPCD